MAYKILLIFIGGGIGTMLRFGVGSVIERFAHNPYPFGTITVNLIGCLIIGLLWGYISAGAYPIRIFDAMRLFIFIGLLGGFTTFSTFALNSIQLAESGRVVMAITYVLISNTLGILLAISGVAIGKLLQAGY